MESKTMTCVCTEEVSSIVLIPSDDRAIFNVTTHRVLEDGTELASETKSETEVLTAEALAAVMALYTKPTVMET